MDGLSRAAVVLACFTAVAQADSGTVVVKNLSLRFDGNQRAQEMKITLADSDTAPPRDWSPFRFLVFEIRSESPQRLLLRLHTGKGIAVVILHPLANTWIRAAIPLEYWTRPPERAGGVPSISHSVIRSGPFYPVSDVRAIGVAMELPIGDPAFLIRTIRLTEESPDDGILDLGVRVDGLGRWMTSRWSTAEPHPTLDEVRELWKKDLPEAPTARQSTIKRRATGFFRVEQVDGRWWFVDPDGRPFFSHGVNGLRPDEATRIEGREQIFAEVPTRATGGLGSFTLTNLMRRFGDNWKTAWLDHAVRSLRAWGFNTVTDVTTASMPYTVTLNGTMTEGELRRECESRKNDPLLLGYFVTDSRIVPSVRKYDPNHLTLGNRLNGNVSDEALRSLSVFDVVSLTVYDYLPRRAVLDHIHKLTGRPVLVSEFQFGTPRDGMSAGFRQTRDEDQRGIAYRLFVENLAVLPYAVGAHWSQYFDQPATGTPDGENYHIGLVDITGLPYPSMLGWVKKAHAAVYGLHSGTDKYPFAIVPKVQ